MLQLLRQHQGHRLARLVPGDRFFHWPPGILTVRAPLWRQWDRVVLCNRWFQRFLEFHLVLWLLLDLFRQQVPKWKRQTSMSRTISIRRKVSRVSSCVTKIHLNNICTFEICDNNHTLYKIFYEKRHPVELDQSFCCNQITWNSITLANEIPPMLFNFLYFLRINVALYDRDKENWHR